MRTDLSATLFLCDPESYEGGELVIEDTYGQHRVKLPAGHLVLYPASSLHCVTPVTRGVRQASFLWIQSMVRDDKQRAMLYDLDRTIQSLKARFGDGEERSSPCSTCSITTCCASGRKCDPLLMTEACGRQV